MNITINKKKYAIKTKFAACARVAPLIADVDPEKPLTIINTMMTNGPEIIRRAIEANKLTPVPTLEEIEDALDSQEGKVGEIVNAFINKTMTHITGGRIEEVTKAAEGKN